MVFNWSISLGNVLTVLSILGIGLRALQALRKFEKQMDRLLWEHELMWQEYASTHALPIRPIDGVL